MLCRIESLHVDLLPQSLYGSFLELGCTARIIEGPGRVMTFRQCIKIVAMSTESNVTFDPSSNSIVYESDQPATITFTLVLGKYHPGWQAGRLCEDSGWKSYPLISNKLLFSIKVAGYDYASFRIVYPDACHAYKNFSNFRICSHSTFKRYVLPEEETPDKPYRIKTSMVGYPSKKLVYYCVDTNKRDNTIISFLAYFREAFIFHVVSILAPLLYAIALLFLWMNTDLETSSKLPITIGALPVYVTMWYRSNVMKSTPTLINFLTVLYVILCGEIAISSFVVDQCGCLLGWLLFLPLYLVQMGLVIALVVHFGSMPAQRSWKMKRFTKGLEWIIDIPHKMADALTGRKNLND